MANLTFTAQQEGEEKPEFSKDMVSALHYQIYEFIIIINYYVHRLKMRSCLIVLIGELKQDTEVFTQHASVLSSVYLKSFQT
jgi:hypothetical protein